MANDLIGYDDFDDISGYGDEIVGADEDDIADILSGLGYDDELGADDWYDDSELGAFNIRSMLAKLAKARGRGRGRRRRYPGRRAALKPVRATSLRRYPLGLGVTTIAAGASAVISASPQLPFKIERMVTAVTGFSINNISVGTVSQFVAAGAIPSEVFAADAVGVALRGDTAVPGVQVQITVTNLGGAPADFSGALIGLVAQ